MSMERLVIQVPKPLKRKLDALRAKGYTASGYIRALLERELSQHKKKGELSYGTERPTGSRVDAKEG